MSLEQTRSRDHYPCHQSGEAREQQQIMHDEGHRKSPLRSDNRSEQSRRQATRQEKGSKSFRVLMDIGARPMQHHVGHPKTLAKT